LNVLILGKVRCTQKQLPTQQNKRFSI